VKVCEKTCIFFFFPIINKYFLMAERSLLSRCPSQTEYAVEEIIWAVTGYGLNFGICIGRAGL